MIDLDAAPPPRRLDPLDARRQSSGGRRTDDRVHDRPVPRRRAAGSRAARGHVAAARRPAALVRRRRRRSAAAPSVRRSRGCAERSARRCSRTTFVSYDEFYRDAGVTPVALDALLGASDIVTIHLPLDATTRGLIDARELALMKPTAFLVNTARGGIVDEAALQRRWSRTARRRGRRRVRESSRQPTASCCGCRISSARRTSAAAPRKRCSPWAGPRLPAWTAVADPSM